MRKVFLEDIQLCKSIFSDGKNFYRDFEQKIEVDFDLEEVPKRRLTHYINWCKKNHRNVSFEFFFFNKTDDGSNEVLVRKCYLERIAESYKFNLSQAIPLLESYLGQSLRLLDNVHDTVLVTEADTNNEPGPRIIYANCNFTKETGFSFEEVCGKSPRLLQGEATSDEAKWKIREGLDSWKVIKQQIKNYTNSGDAFTIELNITPAMDETGWYTHWVSFQRNITKEISEKRSTEKMQEVARIGYWRLNSSSLDVHWSPGVYNLFGVQTEKVSLEEAISYYAEWERERIAKLVDNCIKKGEIFDDLFEFFNASGEKMWVRAYGEPFFEENGEIIEIYGTFQDVSNYLDREQLLESTKKELEDVVKATNLGLWKWDIVNNDLRWGDNMYALYNLSKSDFSGDYDAWLTSLHPDDKGRLESEIEQALDGQKDFDTTFRVITGDNEVRYIKAIATIERDKNNKPLVMSGINIDRTEEQELELSLDEERKMYITQSRLASIGELAAGVGHEINNPLAIAVGSLDSLKRALGSSVVDNKHFKNIEVAHQRIKKITDGLRDFSRDDKNFIALDLNKIISDSVNFVKEIYNSNGIELLLEIDDNLEYYIEGVKSELQQVFMNLLSNAKDAVEHNIDKSIKIFIKNKNDLVQIEVRDNGSGIPLEIQDKIFDNFFTSKEIGKGTGIGLALTQQIVSAHQGRIYFKSQSDLGTSFFIEFPTTQKRPEEVENQSMVVTEKFKRNISVLVIDDEEMLREILVEIFCDLGASVTVAENGQVALEKINENKYDVIVSDIQMPILTGTELLAKLLKDNSLGTSKFFFITGGVSTKNNILQECDGIIHKPFVQNDIFNIINKSI